MLTLWNTDTTFDRVFGVDGERLSADMAVGVLTLHVPKQLT